MAKDICLINKAKLSELTGVSLRTLYNWVKVGKLKPLCDKPLVFDLSDSQIQTLIHKRRLNKNPT